MGRDKGLVPFQGMTMIEYILAQLDGVFAQKIVITNRPSDYRFLNLPLFEDVIPDWGALGGLHAALSHSSTEFALVLACDMPFLNLGFIEHLYSIIEKADAVIPRLGDKKFAEPFRAVYRKTCLDPIARAIRNGNRRVISFFDEVRVRFVDEPEIRQFDPDLRTFLNVNTPEDLAAAQRIAEGTK